MAAWLTPRIGHRAREVCPDCAHTDCWANRALIASACQLAGPGSRVAARLTHEQRQYHLARRPLHEPPVYVYRRPRRQRRLARSAWQRVRRLLLAALAVIRLGPVRD